MRAPTACALLLLCVRALATDVVPLLEDKQLGVAFTAVKFPETLAKDLASGLTNKLLLRVALLRESQAVAQRVVEISIKYDLWDEKFLLNIRVDGTTTTTTSYDKSDEVTKFLTTLRLTQLFVIGDLGRGDFTLKIDMLLNPIERERMDRIRKWVTDNSAYLPGDAGRFDANRAPDARSNALFNKIFEQYFAGADVSAGWQDTATSKPFKLQELGNAR